MGKFLNCVISGKRLIIFSETDEKLRLVVVALHMYGLFMYDSVSSVWGHPVHFTIFPMLRFSKDDYSHCFHPVSAELIIGYLGGIQAITFLAIGHVLTVLWHFASLIYESMEKSYNVQYLENGSSWGEADEKFGCVVLGTAYIGYVSCLIFQYGGSFGALCKISYVKIFERLLLRDPIFADFCSV